MRKSTHQKKLFSLTDEDLDILNKLQEYYGVSSQTEVLRIALRVTKREIETPPETRDQLSERLLRMMSEETDQFIAECRRRVEEVHRESEELLKKSKEESEAWRRQIEKR